jgi:hypothetical protein
MTVLRQIEFAVSDGSVGHMSIVDPALWANQAGDLVVWLGEN